MKVLLDRRELIKQAEPTEYLRKCKVAEVLYERHTTAALTEDGKIIITVASSIPIYVYKDGRRERLQEHSLAVAITVKEFEEIAKKLAEVMQK